MTLSRLPLSRSSAPPGISIAWAHLSLRKVGCPLRVPSRVLASREYVLPWASMSGTRSRSSLGLSRPSLFRSQRARISDAATIVSDSAGLRPQERNLQACFHGVGFAPLQRLQHRKSTCPSHEMRLSPLPFGGTSLPIHPVEGSSGNRSTVPRSNFAASSGFHNLPTPSSFRCIPRVFQRSRTRGVRSLQRFLLSSCRR